MKRAEFIRIVTNAANSIEKINSFSCHELNVAAGRNTHDDAEITKHYAAFYEAEAEESFIGDRMHRRNLDHWERWEKLRIYRLIHLELFKLAYLDSKEYSDIGE